MQFLNSDKYKNSSPALRLFKVLFLTLESFKYDTEGEGIEFRQPVENQQKILPLLQMDVDLLFAGKVSTTGDREQVTHVM